MTPVQSSGLRTKLPSGFATIRGVLEGQHATGSRVTVVGIVTDFRAPVATRGKDWKCQLRIYDESIENDEEEYILVNVFRPEAEMPSMTCGDVVLIFSATLQKYNSDSYSLCTHWTTDIHVYSSARVLEPPKSALLALMPPTRKITRQPSKREHELISQLYHSIDKSRVPSEVQFDAMKIQSLNVQHKFRELKDIQDGKFIDTIVQIVKEPYDLGDKFSLWVSDYTENSLFFNFAFKGGSSVECQDGDPYGYLNKFNNTTGTGTKSDWTGPYGKRSMQISCYEPHASVIRDNGLSSGAWISIRNLQIKFGRSVPNLEGFLRGDMSAKEKINLIPLDPLEDPETINPQLKEVIRRKRDYERLKKSELKGISEAAKAGLKRKAAIAAEGDERKLNAKLRRQAKRAQANQIAQADEPVSLPIANLNTQVKCENQTKPASFVGDMLEYVAHTTTIDGESVEVQLPFINVNYRTAVRVTDFMPTKLEDFARLKRPPSEYDAVTDDGASDSDSETELAMDQHVTRGQEWEWCFYIQLEDAVMVGKEQKKNKIWVLVDNQAAQCLVNLDASDLRRNSKDLESLRQRMAVLWGGLEEHKSSRARKSGRTGPPPHGMGKPADSSDEEQPESKKQKNEQAADVAGRPFSCCIRQYGIKVPEPNAREANAGEGRRWQRVFALYGARITSN